MWVLKVLRAASPKLQGEVVSKHRAKRSRAGFLTRGQQRRNSPSIYCLVFPIPYSGLPRSPTKLLELICVSKFQTFEFCSWLPQHEQTHGQRRRNSHMLSCFLYVVSSSPFPVQANVDTENMDTDEGGLRYNDHLYFDSVTSDDDEPEVEMLSMVVLSGFIFGGVGTGWAKLKFFLLSLFSLLPPNSLSLSLRREKFPEPDCRRPATVCRHTGPKRLAFDPALILNR
ncbi:hypothetical protein ACLB2K_052605 [Fragaria x ananassa]